MGKDLTGKELGRGFSQRPDGRYEARAVVNGKKIDIYNMSLPALKKSFEEEKAKLLRDEKGIRPDLTLKSWFDEWFDKCKSRQLKSEISRKTYKRRVDNTYIKILGNKLLKDISQMNIQDATNELADIGNYSSRGLSEALSQLRECFDSAIANKIIVFNPIVGISIRDENEAMKERRVLSHWEQDALLKATETSYYREMYRILLLTGMRIGEFSGLQWSDVDFQRKKIHIRRSMQTGYLDGKKILELTTPKTANSYRDIPFFGDVEQFFKDWKKKQDVYKKKLGSRWRADPSLGDLVFTTTFGSPVTRYNIIHDMKRVEDNINLNESRAAFIEGREPRVFEHIYPHAFRHTFATRCFEKGLDPLVIQNIMGHANYSTTVSYTHVLEDKTNEAVLKAGDLLA